MKRAVLWSSFFEVPKTYETLCREYVPRPIHDKAELEKALVDALYFRMTLQSDFKALPEVEFSKTFNWKRAKEFAQFTPSLPRQGPQDRV